tara:strand:+ start:595 stop:705 length:111 start_codon:yes stop_codon:yes gene_type:complete
MSGVAVCNKPKLNGTTLPNLFGDNSLEVKVISVSAA